METGHSEWSGKHITGKPRQIVIFSYRSSQDSCDLSGPVRHPGSIIEGVCGRSGGESEALGELRPAPGGGVQHGPGPAASAETGRCLQPGSE